MGLGHVIPSGNVIFSVLNSNISFSKLSTHFVLVFGKKKFLRTLGLKSKSSVNPYSLFLKEN